MALEVRSGWWPSSLQVDFEGQHLQSCVAKSMKTPQKIHQMKKNIPSWKHPFSQQKIPKKSSIQKSQSKSLSFFEDFCWFWSDLMSCQKCERPNRSLPVSWWTRNGGSWRAPGPFWQGRLRWDLFDFYLCLIPFCWKNWTDRWSHHSGFGAIDLMMLDDYWRMKNWTRCLKHSLQVVFFSKRGKSQGVEKRSVPNMLSQWKKGGPKKKRHSKFDPCLKPFFVTWRSRSVQRRSLFLLLAGVFLSIWGMNISLQLLKKLLCIAIFVILLSGVFRGRLWLLGLWWCCAVCCGGSSLRSISSSVHQWYSKVSWGGCMEYRKVNPGDAIFSNQIQVLKWGLFATGEHWEGCQRTFWIYLPGQIHATWLKMGCH